MTITKVWGKNEGLSGLDWEDATDGWLLATSARLYPTNDGFGRIAFDSRVDSAYTLSKVIDTARTNNIITISHTPNPSGYVVRVRGRSTTFNQTDLSPTWETYSSRISRAWRYMQLRIDYITGTPPSGSEFQFDNTGSFVFGDSGGFNWDR